ncbi:hypothetical protein V8E36_005035 [Tilletia maclaganii]
MAADYWRSSQCNNWQLTHEQLALARLEDARFATPLELAAIGIWIANTISNLCRRLGLRQRVTATATVFARRFYAKNAYAATDPCLVCASCVYVAAKVEEMPIHVKQCVTEAMRMFAEMSAGKFAFPSDRAILAEMEFYLIEDLEFELIVHHPYRALVSIYDAVGKDSKKAQQQQQSQYSFHDGLDMVDSPASSDVFFLAGVSAGEEVGAASVGPSTVGPSGIGTGLGGTGLGVGLGGAASVPPGIDGHGARGMMLGASDHAARNLALDAVTLALRGQPPESKSGTGPPNSSNAAASTHPRVEPGSIPYRLDILDERVFQMAWPILNDVYRTEIPLLYPPYLIALAALCLAVVVQEDAFQKLQNGGGAMAVDLVAATPREVGSSLAGLNNNNFMTPPPPGLGSTSAGPSYRERFGRTTATMSGTTPLPHHHPTTTPQHPPPPTPQQHHHPLVLFLASLNLSVPALAEIVQEMVSGYEVRHACKSLVDDGRGMLGLLEGMREKRRVGLMRSAQAAQQQAGTGVGVGAGGGASAGTGRR